MRERMVADFVEIFQYAEKNYGIKWNDANKLFFKGGGSECDEGNPLNYKGYNQYELLEMMENINCLIEDHTRTMGDVTYEEIMEAEPISKAYLIMGKFMLANGVNEMVVLNDSG